LFDNTQINIPSFSARHAQYNMSYEPIIWSPWIENEQDFRKAMDADTKKKIYEINAKYNAELEALTMTTKQNK
jgi:hypothetical protein